MKNIIMTIKKFFKQKWLQIGLIFLTVAILSSLLAVLQYQNREKQASKQEAGKKTVAKINLEPLSNNFYLVSDVKSSYIAKDYIFKQDIDYSKKYEKIFSSKDLKDKDSNTVTVTKVTSPEKVYKTFDLRKLAKQYHTQAVPREIESDFYQDKMTGEIHFAMKVYIPERIDDYSDYEKANILLYVGLESGRMVDYDTDLEKIGFKDFTDDFQATDLRQRLSSYGIQIGRTANNYYFIRSIGLKAVKLDGLMIKKEFPAIADQLEGGDKNFTYLGDEGYLEIIRLLGKEEGGDLYTGLTLSSKYSKDKQEHQLSSYDDYLKWYQKPEY